MIMPRPNGSKGSNSVVRGKVGIRISPAGRDDLQQVPRHGGHLAAERLQRVGLIEQLCGRRAAVVAGVAAERSGARAAVDPRVVAGILRSARAGRM